MSVTEKEINNFLRIFGTSLRHYSLNGVRERAVAAWNRRAPDPDREAKVAALVEVQTNDAGLWFQAKTAPEAYLQQELRKLHAAIEARSPESAALQALEGAPE